MSTAHRLAIYLPSLGGGGAERVMLHLANAFADRGLAVDLVLARAEGPYLSDVSSGVRVVDLDSPSVSRSLVPLARYLKQFRPQALLSALSHANVIAIAARALSGLKCRLVISERVHFSSTLKSGGSLAQRLLPIAMRYSYPMADGIVAVSRGVADDLAKAMHLPRESIDVVYNPVVVGHRERLQDDPIEGGVVHKDTPPIILGVGRLDEQKDFPTLITAFARLRSQRQVRLVILGEGPLRQELETLIASLDCRDDIDLPGFDSDPFRWMRSASLFVLSSAYEGLPGTLIQAMACGTPVVSTDCPSGPAEILENGKWGRLVPVGDVDAMANAMGRTLDEENHPDVTARAADFNLNAALIGYATVLGLSEMFA